MDHLSIKINSTFLLYGSFRRVYTYVYIGKNLKNL